MTDQHRGAADAPALLWFTPDPAPEAALDPERATNRRPALTRERVVSEALAVITTKGVQALTMRSLATRLAVVPGALYRHVRNKEQLHDLILDQVLAEVDVRTDPASAWTDRLTTLARRLREVLERHPGTAGLLTSRAPLTPHSLAVAEAFLEPLDAAGLPPSEAAMAYRLIHDYTVGFALGGRASAGEQRLQDPATRRQLLTFVRGLPADRFPLLAALGEQIWVEDREERFAANLDTLVQGLRTRS